MKDYGEMGGGRIRGRRKVDRAEIETMEGRYNIGLL